MAKGDVSVVVEIILLLAALLVVYVVVKSMTGSPTSASKLAAAFQIACQKGHYEMKVRLPMRTVGDAWKTFYFGTNFDPSYLVYYGHFPPLGSAGWDIYKEGMPDIVFAILDEEHAGNMEAYRSHLEEKARQALPSGRNITVVFINVLSGKPEDKQSAYFEKFGFCGIDSLCYKHGRTIVAGHLGGCDVDAVVRESGSSYGPFYMASPCSGKIRIRKGECELDGRRVPVYDSEGKEIGNAFVLTSFINSYHPLFKGSKAKVPCLVVEGCEEYDMSGKLMQKWKKCVKPLEDNAFILKSDCYGAIK